MVWGSRLVTAIGVLGACSFEPPADVGEEDAAPDSTPSAIDAAPGSIDASIDAMACSATTCVDGMLRTCGEGGAVERVDECVLGCFSDDRCNWLEPSNQLGEQLEDAAQRDAVIVPASAIVDSDVGTIRSGTDTLAVAATTVLQGDGSAIRVFLARAFTLDDLRVQGALAVAFVAVDDVDVVGVIDLSADRNVAGPGARTCIGAGAGVDESGGQLEPIRLEDIGGGDDYVLRSSGAGGGGFGSHGGDGGYGGTNTAPGSGGAFNGTASLVPLRGGCPGGGTGPGYRGSGGGAIQIVSAAGEIRIATPSGVAGIDAGGGGGHPAAGPGAFDDLSIRHGSAGGGAGGGILLEAGRVVLGETAAVIASGGGGGGGSGGLCTDAGYGRDARLDGEPAAGGACPAEDWGTPAVGGAGAATDPAANGGPGGYRGSGSGGGGHGRVRINTAGSTYSADPAAIIRGALSTGSVTLQ